MKSDAAAGLPVLDCVYLLPVPAIVYHPSAGTTDVTALKIDEDSTVYLDSAVDMTSITQAPLMATSLDVLHILADGNSAASLAQKKARVYIYVTPRYSLWR
jgi:hypothetical protein